MEVPSLPLRLTLSQGGGGGGGGGARGRERGRGTDGVKPADGISGGLCKHRSNDNDSGRRKSTFFSLKNLQHLRSSGQGVVACKSRVTVRGMHHTTPPNPPPSPPPPPPRARFVHVYGIIRGVKTRTVYLMTTNCSFLLCALVYTDLNCNLFLLPSQATSLGFTIWGEIVSYVVVF